MALNYLEEQKKKQQQEVQPQGAYNLAGVSATTQQQLQKSQGGYQPNQQAQAAQQNMQAIQQQRPQSYASKYGPALQSILEQIQNPGTFKYEFNGDENFRYLADLYTQNAKKANINAQGQAAALTGGYGNSYGAAAGAQAYQEALLPLYQQGMALRQQALDQYNADRADRYNQLKAVQGMDESDYGRYQDTMQNWRADLQNAQSMYQDERNFGYNEYADALANAMNIGKMESESYRADQDEAYRRDSLAQNQAQFDATTQLEWAQLQEKQRQFDADLTEEQRQYNQKVAMQYALSILEKGQIPSNELLVAAGLSMDDAKLLVTKAAASGPAPKTGADEVDYGAAAALAAPDFTGTTKGTSGIGLDYETEAKQALAAASLLPVGSKDRTDLEDYAEFAKKASEGKDKAIETNRNKTTTGNITQAEYEAALRAAGLVSSDDKKGKKYTYKNGKLVLVDE